MKKIINQAIIFSLIAIYSHAQSNGISTTGKWGSQLFLSDVNGRPFENKYADINGSPYLFPDFKFANIILKDGRIYKDVKIKLNLTENELEFIASNGEVGYIGKGVISQIGIKDTLKSEILNYNFQSGFSKIDNQTNIHFYQVLVEGNYGLLKSINKNIDEHINELSGEKYKEFVVRENIYLLHNGTLKRIKRDKEFILSLFNLHISNIISQYIDTNKVNFKNENQLINFIVFCNTL